MEVFNVSRSTIVKDLREIRLIVADYNLVLEYNVEHGYEIHGSEIHKRSLILVINSSFVVFFLNDSDSSSDITPSS